MSWETEHKLTFFKSLPTNFQELLGPFVEVFVVVFTGFSLLYGSICKTIGETICGSSVGRVLPSDWSKFMGAKFLGKWNQKETILSHFPDNNPLSSPFSLIILEKANLIILFLESTLGQNESKGNNYIQKVYKTLKLINFP